MNLQGVFQWLESWPLSVAVRESSWMFPAVESVHVIAITLVVGSILIVDLRVLGWASRDERVRQLAGSILPWTWGGIRCRGDFGVYAVCRQGAHLL